MTSSTMLATLRHLRHGPLKGLGPVWTVLGNGYRFLQSRSPWPSSVTMKIGPYGPFRFDARFAFSGFETWGGGKNPGFGACIESCRGASCVLDVGGHVGLIAIPASRLVAPGGRVYSFEPAAFNHRLLERHIRLNGADNIVAVADLVGGSDDEAVDFFEQGSDYPMNSIAEPEDTKRTIRTSRRQVTLDAYCEAHNLSPDLIKIDTEGAEVGVLQGARKVIERCRPTIFLSVHPRQLQTIGLDTSAVEDLVSELGYRAETPDGETVKHFGASEYRLVPREMTVDSR